MFPELVVYKYGWFRCFVHLLKCQSAPKGSKKLLHSITNTTQRQTPSLTYSIYTYSICTYVAETEEWANPYHSNKSNIDVTGFSIIKLSEAIMFRCFKAKPGYKTKQAKKTVLWACKRGRGAIRCDGVPFIFRLLSVSPLAWQPGVAHGGITLCNPAPRCFLQSPSVPSEPERLLVKEPLIVASEQQSPIWWYRD